VSKKPNKVQLKRKKTIGGPTPVMSSNLSGSGNIDKFRSKQQRSSQLNRFGWLRDDPDHRDLQYADQRMAFEAPINSQLIVDLTPGFRGQPPYDQLNLRSCSPNAIAAAFEFDQLRQGVPAWVPSRLFIYYNARALNGAVSADCGASLRDCMKVLVSAGVPPEAHWPYDPSGFQIEPPPQAYAEARFNEVTGYFKLDNTDINQVRACLSAGFPFAFGLTLFNSYYRTGPDGIISMPVYGDAKLGPHALLAVGYNDAVAQIKVRNSFGASWGEVGYGYLPYQYLTNPQLAGDAWTIRAVTPAGTE
jgi:C1A family cysteine protease